MGDLSDTLTSLGVPADMVSAISGVQKFTGALSSLFTAFSLGSSVLSALGLISSTSELDQVKAAIDNLYQKLTSQLKHLDSGIIATSAQQQRDFVYSQLAIVDDHRQVTQGYLANPKDEQQKSAFLGVLSNLYTPANTLSPPGAWTQVASPRVYYNDIWTRQTSPPDLAGQGLAFDYRLQLPAYMKAVSVLIMVGMAADRTFASGLRAKLQEHLTALAGVHDKVLQGFYPVPPPSREHLVGILKMAGKFGFQYIGPHETGFLPGPPTWPPSYPWAILGAEKEDALMDHVIRRYFASQIWREIGAIRSETDPIIASTFISTALPYLSPRGIGPAILYPWCAFAIGARTLRPQRGRLCASFRERLSHANVETPDPLLVLRLSSRRVLRLACQPNITHYLKLPASPSYICWSTQTRHLLG